MCHFKPHQEISQIIFLDSMFVSSDYESMSIALRNQKVLTMVWFRDILLCQSILRVQFHRLGISTHYLS